jgi:hypothetical protein
MPGFLLTLQTPAFCTHGGKATPVPPAGRVTSNGMGVVTQAHVYAITGCAFPAMTLGAQPPCVAGMLFSGTIRVRSMGLFLGILPDSMPSSKGLPNPTPLIFAPAGSPRVLAT